LTRIASWLHDGRITGWVALVPLIYFATEWVVSASWRGYYAYRDDRVGLLGIAFCGPEGNWPCSDLYRAMNVALLATGLAVAFVAAGFVAQRVTGRSHAVLLLVAGLGLACSGVITQNVDYAWNLTATASFVTLGSISVLLIAVSSTSKMSGERRGIAVFSGLVSFVGVLSFVGEQQIFGSGGAQRMAIYGILVAVIALGAAGMRSQKVAAIELAEEVR